MQADLSNRVTIMELQIRRLRTVAVISTVGLVLATVLFLFNFRSAHAQSTDRVLRVRGIVIEDASGRERILIGAPIPAAQNRVRTDEARVRAEWAKRYPNPDTYLNFYKDYQHATNGILVLDEKGFDRVALGDPVPDPNIGKRLGPSTGMIINDEQGNERSGYGLLNVNGKYRVVVGLDSSQGRESLSLVAMDEGKVGMTINDAQRTVYLGSAPANEKMAGAEEPFYGILVKGPDGIKTMTASAK
jgi:hypothetical protein